MGSNFPSESFSSSSTEETHSHFWALVISQSGRASSVASHPSTRFLVFTMATMKLSFWRVYRYIACSSWSFISRRKHEWEGCEALPLCDHTHAMWCAEQNLLWNDKLECIFFSFFGHAAGKFHSPYLREFQIFIRRYLKELDGRLPNTPSKDLCTVVCNGQVQLKATRKPTMAGTLTKRTLKFAWMLIHNPATNVVE